MYDTLESAHRLGDEVFDIVTGFRGIITGRAEHLTGCNTYGVASKVKRDNSGGELVWYDENRLRFVRESKVSKQIKEQVVIQNKDSVSGPCGNPLKSHGKL